MTEDTNTRQPRPGASGTDSQWNASEETLRLIFDNAFDGISLYREQPDGSRVLVECNDRYAEMSGRSKDELLAIGNTIRLQKNLEATWTRQDFVDAMQRQDTVRGRFTWIRPDGQDNVVEYNAVPIQVGDEVLTIGFDREITDRIDREQVLRQERDFLDAVVGRASEGIFVSDRAGKIMLYNHYLEELTGYSLQEAQKGFLDLLFPDPDARTQAISTAQAALDGQEVDIQEWEITCSDGMTRHVLVSLDTFSYGEQELFIGVMHDITDRKRVEVALRQKNRQQAQLFDTARHLASSLEFKEVMMRIAVSASEILNAFGCTIYTLEPDGQTLMPVVVVDPDYEEQIMNAPLDVHTSFTGRAVLEERGLIFNDAHGISIGYQIPDTPENEQEHIITAPFILDSEVLGALCINRYKTRFTEEELSLTETFAAYAVTALRNAQAHNALRREVQVREQTENRYRMTIDAMDDIVHVVDRDLRVVLCNQTMRDRLLDMGYKGDPLGKMLYELFPFLSLEVRREYLDVFASGKPLLTEEKTDVTGQTLWTATRKFPIVQQGRVARVLTIVHDITADKALDEALAHRMAMEALVVDLSTRFIHVSTHDVEQEIRSALQSIGEFVGVDRCYLHLFTGDLSRIDRAYEWAALGTAPREDDLAGLPIAHHRWAMDKKRRQETMLVPRVADLPPEAATERTDWMSEGIQSVLSIPLSLSGKPIGALGLNSVREEKEWQEGDVHLLELVGNVLSNVLARQQAEAEKQDLQEKLDRARLMESLGLLAGGVAHDLNNLLGPLVAYPELILMDLPPDSPSRGDVERIQEAAEKAASVVQDLLTLTRRAAYRMAPLDLNCLVQDYLRSPSYQDLCSRHPLVSTEVDLEADLLVSGSDFHLLKVIMNLTANAFEAMPDGGTLTIRTRCESLDRPHDGYERIEAGDYVILAVSDTGTGIADEDLGRIFEPFYTRKEMGRSGSGLGLAVVQGVVRDHRGHIDLRTQTGQGTTFSLYLPVTRQEPAVDSREQADYGGTEKVLVVDDLKAQRDLAQRLLDALGYRVETVSSGREAIEYLAQAKADVVVLDMIMEDDFDGLDTYREIVRLHPNQKAVIASGFSETDRVKRALDLGAGAFLKKPYTLGRLGEAIRRVLDRQNA